MTAPTRGPQPRPHETHTFFPSPRPAPAIVAPPTARPRPFDDRKDDEHAPEEPGYGHGV
jgi:hypothetical protein